MICSGERERVSVFRRGKKAGFGGEVEMMDYFVEALVVSFQSLFGERF